MKLSTFVPVGSATPRVGALMADGKTLIDLAEAELARTGRTDPALASMQSLIESGEKGLALARQVVDAAPDASRVSLRNARILAPLQPVALRCCSVFDGHHRGVARALRELGRGTTATDEQVPALFQRIPAYYKANHLNVRGPGDEVEWPIFGDDLDFELELAAVIGRRGKNIPVAQALGHIFGFSIYNDLSARDPQLAEMSMGLGPVKSKDFDGGNVLGPFIVTTDELDGDDVLAVARINGKEIGRARSTEMRQKWAEIISYRSLGETIHAGEVITSGAFTGCSGIEHMRFLEPGDEVELEIEGIGILSNRIGKRPLRPVHWPAYPPSSETMGSGPS